ncbi:2-amino-3,7-dideoxy-D-threo-hept-6-ulosonate synthase [Actinoplanes sp. NPDC051494]|uniref:2-amino-3,7-dideoxy-D-threo-hept-6-ulosonate synthase n=1 Tax=Actinoplanes sp. NPDC051494 TaxID=3363907 RepID=UPI0037907BA1
MDDNAMFARRPRLRHLYRGDAPGLLIVPLDHAIGAGPLRHRGDLDTLVAEIAANGADAVVLHKGALRRLRPHRIGRLCLVLHLNASTGLARDPDAKYPVATVEEALRLGADAVSVHVNLSSRTEDRQVAHLAEVSRDCQRWGVPLLAMMYVRGPDVLDGTAPRLVEHAVTVAAELGADLVKTSLPADPAEIAAITAGCPVPVLAAGGTGATPRSLAVAVRAGAGGIAAGRAVFTAPDPGAMVRQLAAVVHDRTPAAAR